MIGAALNANFVDQLRYPFSAGMITGHHRVWFRVERSGSPIVLVSNLDLAKPFLFRTHHESCCNESAAQCTSMCEKLRGC